MLHAWPHLLYFSLGRARSHFKFSLAARLENFEFRTDLGERTRVTAGGGGRGSDAGHITHSGGKGEDVLTRDVPKGGPACRRRGGLSLGRDGSRSGPGPGPGPGPRPVGGCAAGGSRGAGGGRGACRPQASVGFRDVHVFRVRRPERGFFPGARHGGGRRRRAAVPHLGDHIDSPEDKVLRAVLGAPRAGVEAEVSSESAGRQARFIGGGHVHQRPIVVGVRRAPAVGPSRASRP